jgi:hypothetical protein
MGTGFKVECKQMTINNDDNAMDISPELAPQLSKMDTVALNMVKAYPDVNNTEIANKLIEIGAIKNQQSLFNRLSKNTYLRGEINRLREQVKQDHTRVVFPLAHKRMVKALKNKDLHDKDVFPYVKLAYDKELSSKEEREQTVNTQINIESLQMMINKAIE